MAWVRYDDQFPINGKVTAVIAEDPGALALQLLANTWSNTTKFPGYIPSHQPGILVADKQLGARWADLLVRAGLFHVRGEECAACRVEYASLPVDKATGYVIHDAEEYRAPTRDRTTAGTSAELSAKRRDAGRRGGKASAARRKAGEGEQDQAKQPSQATGQANQASDEAPSDGRGDDARTSTTEAADTEGASDTATGLPAETGFTGQANQAKRQASAVSKSGKLPLAGVSPDPVPVPDSSVASNEATARSERTEQEALDGMPDPPEPTADQRAFGLARWWLDEREQQNTPVVAAGRHGPLHVLKNLFKPFIDKDYTDDEVKIALGDLDLGVPSKQQLERALNRHRRPGAAANDRQGRSGDRTNPRRLNGSNQVHNTHDIEYEPL